MRKDEDLGPEGGEGEVEEKSQNSKITGYADMSLQGEYHCQIYSYHLKDKIVR